MNQRLTSDGGLSEEVRFRIPLPLAIPLVSLLVIAVVTIGFSRILLSVPKEVAVVIAIAVAINLLGACAFVALRPHLARNNWAELLIVLTYPLVIGLVIAQLGIGEGHSVAEGEGAHAAAAGAAGTTTEVAAADVAFDTDEITLAAGEETELEFVNNDASSVPHNIAIYQEEGGKNLFKGEVIPGGQSMTYTIPALDKGTYYFRCDVHPEMDGEVTVE